MMGMNADASARWLRAGLLAYGGAVLGSFLLATPLSFVHRELGAFRNWQIALNALLFVSWLVLGRLSAPSWKLPRWLVVGAAAASAAWLVAAQLCRFYALTTNGVDFSIFDWMLYSTAHGSFGYSPIYGVNHFGVHPSFILLPLVPLHRLFEGPLLLVLVTAAVVWAAIFPLWRLAMLYLEREVWAGLVVLAYLTNPWVGRVLDGGFRPEVFFPCLGLTFILGWVRRRPVLWIPALVAFLAIKEDAAFYAAAIALASLVIERDRWRPALAVLLVSVTWTVAVLGWLQPVLLAGDGDRRPEYLKFWGQYGSTLSDILAGMASSPLRLLKDVATSGWYRMFAPALFLPLVSRAPMAAMAPALFLLGTASYGAMHEYKTYYPLPLVPFFLWGLLEAHRNLARWWPSARWREPALALALLGWPLVGGGYVKFQRPDVQRLRELEQVEQRLSAAQAICVQTIIFPHLAYALKPRPLDRGCMAQPGAVAVIHPGLDPFPYSRARLEQAVNHAAARGKVQQVGGFVLVSDPTIPLE